MRAGQRMWGGQRAEVRGVACKQSLSMAASAGCHYVPASSQQAQQKLNAFTLPPFAAWRAAARWPPHRNLHKHIVPGEALGADLLYRQRA